MDSSTRQSDSLKPDVQQSALIPSALPTPQGAETPSKSPQPATNSFPRTAVTYADQEVSESHYLRPGANIDGYVVVKTIANTKMSVVFQARQPGSGQLVAVKLIQQGAFADREAIERFEREIKALGLMQPHKHIVPIYHVGRHRNEPYYVMPFVAGGSLANHLERFQADRRKSVALIEKIARAVHQLHTQTTTILHRDIKPANILLGADDEPLLADFGLIKLLDDSNEQTQAHRTLGTPAYMAPEQTALVPTPVSARTDVWALGVVLYELLTGKRPFAKAENEDTHKLFWKIVNQEPPRPRSVRPDLEAGLEAVVMKCLEKRPEDRFGSAAELAEELGRWLGGEAVATMPSRRTGRVKRWAGKYKWPAAALGFVGSLFAVVVTVASLPADVNGGLKQHQRELANGRGIFLIEEKGFPTWSTVLTPGDGEVSLDPEGVYTIDSNRFFMVELMRNVPIRHYRVEARLRHNSSHLGGRVGLFTSHHIARADWGKAHFMWLFGFNDIIDARIRPQQAVPLPPNTPPVPPLAGNYAELQSLFAHVDKGPKPQINSFLPATSFLFQAKGLSGGAWHDLSLEVDADQIIAVFDGQLSSVPIANCDKVTRTGIGMLPAADGRLSWSLANLPHEFDPGGSIGIAIRKGSVSVSNVKITPLD